MELIREASFLDLKSRIQDLQEEIIEAISSIAELLYFIQGAELEKLEREFAKCCNCEYPLNGSSEVYSCQLEYVPWMLGRVVVSA